MKKICLSMIFALVSAFSFSQTMYVCKDGGYTEVAIVKGLEISLAEGIDSITFYEPRFEDAPAEYYAVEIAAAENGTVTADVAEAQVGETVTLTVAPAEGYELSSLTVACTDEGTEVKVAATEEECVYTFTMPDGKVTVYATFINISEKVYYYYIGSCEPFMKNIYQDEDFEWHYEHKDADLGEILKNLSEAKKSSKLVTGPDSEAYAKGEKIENPDYPVFGNGKETWYCCAIGPKEWYEWAKTGVQNDALQGSSQNMKQGYKEFKIGSDTYAIGISGKLSLTIRLSVK